MSVETVAGKFMELCKAGKHFEVMRTMYAPEMVSVEGDGKETVGKEAVIHKSEVFQGNNAITGQDLRGPSSAATPTPSPAGLPSTPRSPSPPNPVVRSKRTTKSGCTRSRTT
jgi:hypothetical protein